MKAQELRIGNLVETVYGFSHVRALSDGYIGVFIGGKLYDFNDNYIKPIQLTEEWLVKFGWLYYNGQKEGVLTKDFGCKMDVDYIDCELLIKSHYEPYSMYRVTSVKHVHQLQNLYFALTGEELEIKE